MSRQLVFTCQECGLVGGHGAAFKKVEVQTGPIKFAYILCNLCAKPHEGSPDDQPTA